MHAVCVNMTMANLAEQLPNLAPGCVDRPVVDSTGLKGTYDLNLAWGGKKPDGPGRHHHARCRG